MMMVRLSSLREAGTGAHPMDDMQKPDFTQQLITKKPDK
jgi:hypothetical protein